MSETTHRSLRLALASLLAVALIAQLAIGMSRSGLTVARFFSYFTVLSNTSAVVVLSMLAIRPSRDSSPRFASFRGASTVYMSVTGLIYAIVLAPAAVDVGLTEPWVDWSIHVFGPLAMLADWFIDRPHAKLPAPSVAVWLIFPFSYLVYTLIRGPIVDWYPYPILDPAESGGYGGVAVWSGVVLLVILGFSYLYYWWANRVDAQPRVR